MNKQIFPLTAGVLGGISLGWLVRVAQSKRKQMPAQPTITDRVKRFERKLYKDGLKRANEIQEIKRDVENRI